jgi:hypothetical protein
MHNFLLDLDDMDGGEDEGENVDESVRHSQSFHYGDDAHLMPSVPIGGYRDYGMGSARRRCVACT